ncbi:hypothetical protein [Nocardiopsis synnemataformans]|uniref:hypothetical protein n=1 Tax=Nocardiopsis synnemataformans TaxID=61305 RepID=UPI003EC0671F
MSSLNNFTTALAVTPVGVSIRPTPAGWGWVILTPTCQEKGVFWGARAALSAHLTERADSLTAPHPCLVVWAGVRGSLQQVLLQALGHRAARHDGTDVDEPLRAAVRLSGMAYQKAQVCWPHRLHDAVDLTLDPPLAWPWQPSDQVGRIACDASRDPNNLWGGWAVVMESGWHAAGRVHDSHAQLDSSVLEFMAVCQAVRLINDLPYGVDIYNDNQPIVEMLRAVSTAPSAARAYRCAPHVPIRIIDPLWQFLRRRKAPTRVRWRSRNSTATLSWADDLSRQARQGLVSTTGTVLDLTGAQGQLDRFSQPPAPAMRFLDAAAAKDWTVQSTQVRPVGGGGQRWAYTVVLGQGPRQVTATWTRTHGKWSQGRYRVDDGQGLRPYTVPWQQARSVLQ